MVGQRLVSRLQAAPLMKIRRNFRIGGLLAAVCATGCFEEQGPRTFALEEHFGEAAASDQWRPFGEATWDNGPVVASCGDLGWFTRDGFDAEDLSVETTVRFLETDVECGWGAGVLARADEHFAIGCVVSSLAESPLEDPEAPRPPDDYEAGVTLLRFDLTTGHGEVLGSAAAAVDMGHSTVRLELVGSRLVCRAEGAAVLEATAEDPDPRPGAFGLVSDEGSASFLTFAAANDGRE